MTGRSRAAQLSVVLAATLGLAFIAVVSSRSHEQDEPPPGPSGMGPGPKRGAAVETPRGLIGLEITLGLKDEKRTAWEGDVSVSEGRVLGLDVIRAAPEAQVNGGKFKVETKKKAANKKKAQQAGPVPAVLHANLDALDTVRVTVRTGQGEFAFKPAELKPGGKTLFLNGEASVEKQEAAVRLTGRGTEDDFPAAAKAPGGTVWLAYTEYQAEAERMNAPLTKGDYGKLVPSKHGDRIRLRPFDGRTWQTPVDVTDGGLDIWRPSVAVDGGGNVWVSWAQQTDGDWDIYYRVYSPGRPGENGSLGPVVRVTRAKGSDFHVVSATDSKGDVWLAWQAFRGDNYEILASRFKEVGDKAEPFKVSDSPANDWAPAIAADEGGGVFVAWDTYDKGNYDVRLRDVGRDAAPVTVAGTARFEGRPSLAVDRAGRVWVAYEEGDEQWGKDYAHEGNVQNVGQEKNPGFALYVNRTVKLKVLDGAKLQVPESGSEPSFGSLVDRNKSVPRLGFGGDGTLWLLVRHHPLPGGAGEVWVGSALSFDGQKWSAPRHLSNSANLIDNRPALVPVGDDLVAVYSSDHRQNAQTRVEDDLYTARFVARSKPSESPKLVADEPAPAATLAAVHANEVDDVARVRSYRAEVGGKTLRPLRGEFHRHTEVSSHRDQDGLLEDSWRYALDAASLDWMGNGDHDNGFGFEYMWWIIQKNADLHLNTPRFVAAQTYERSVVYPNGHRNVMMPKRGIRPLPRGSMDGTAEEGTPDTKALYDYLKHFGGICASHTSATNMGTDWRDNDPEVEPVVEIYQGHRHNYEHFGAPRSPTETTQIGGYQPKGFIWNALEKGYKLGFQSSSDHVSTHWSYAVVFAEDTTRQAVIDAFKKRHCYAATDNILLDVRSGEHFMGDTFTTKEKPALKIVVKGTAKVTKVHVVRDNKYALTTEPGGQNAELTYTDDDAKPGDSHYYYVRVEQADGNLAWGSPVWVTYGK